MEDRRDEAGPTEGPSRQNSWWGSDFMEKFDSMSLLSQEDNLSSRESPRNYEEYETSQSASQILWSTGMLSEPIPNGFYSVIPDKRLKEHFDSIPTFDELHALGSDGYKADTILVDVKKDKKLSMLKQLIIPLVRGLNSNPPAMIKKIAGLVSDFYKRPNAESPAKAALEETAQIFETCGIQLLGQIKHGACRPRAILFKVLADTVGLESSLVVGLPNDGTAECAESYKHMSVIVVLNSVELLVDLIRFPGQLIPRSTRAIYMTHVSAGESDSAENDSCDSPLEPNSPLYGYPERADPDSSIKDESLQFHRKLEAPSNLSGLSLRNMMLRSTTSIDRKLSLSHSEPDIATTFWRRSRKKVIAEHRTASSRGEVILPSKKKAFIIVSQSTDSARAQSVSSHSGLRKGSIRPEHPSFRARGRSMLSGDRHTIRDYNEDIATSRSEGSSMSDARRIRRRSISMTPEIGDDIVRAVRLMNETLKQNRLLKETGADRSFPNMLDGKNNDSDPQNVAGGRSALYTLQSDHINSQKAISLPSSPHQYRNQISERGGQSGYGANIELVSTWNKILDSPMFHDKSLLPFQEWHIDFSELTVGTRVGIGFFGEVFRGLWNGTEVAIKVFLEQDLTAENMEDFCNEISILSRLRHPNVILFLGACTKPPRLSMITEYMEMGSLYFLIHLSGQKKRLTWRKRLKMLRDICRGLMCIHRMKIVHRDLKSANCLVNKHWTVKICDFGLSRMMTETPMRDESSAGTPEWMAPELIRKEPFSVKCDIFSLGVIMWELCTLNRPWDGVPPERVVYAVANEGSRLEIPEGPLGRLISDCWAEPHERPSCEEILSRLVDCEYSLS